MEAVCNRCKRSFAYNDDMIIDQSHSTIYLKCPYCEKVTTHKADASIPLFISQAVRQQLYDLGYSKSEVDAMRPESAQLIIERQLVKTKEKMAQEKPLSKASEVTEEVAGWLVVHDEEARAQTFELRPGHNYVGRKSVSKPVAIGIETTDLTMSRRHCDIEVSYSEKHEDYEFVIHDIMSTNGTILNGRIRRKLHEQDQICLKDNDTFQLGMTKITLRKNTGIHKKETLIKEVLNGPYKPTVKVSLDKIEYLFK